MSCRHDLANGTCSRCYPATGKVDPGPEEDYEPNLEGPGAVSAARERPIELARPEDLAVKPEIALHLMVKNGESVVGRLLDQVGPYLAEVVAVLNDCSDGTDARLRGKCAEHGLAYQGIEVSSRTHPDLYIVDVPETYQVGEPLCGELYEGPFVGRPILADWATARNVGWEKSRSAWKLHLDADDVVDDPHCLPGLCRVLEERGLHVASSRYHYDRARSGSWRADAFRERLARDVPGIRWRGVVHECLAGYAPGRVAHVEGNLVVRDLRDSRGTEIRIPGRNFKILYHRARRRGWSISPREMVYLGAEARHLMPTLAARLLERACETSSWAEERAWAASMRGELYEEDELFAQASAWYRQSLQLHPGALAAFRLARSSFRERRWQDVVDAYARGVKNARRPQLLDGGELYEAATKIFVAAALRELGRHAESAEMFRQAREAFPRNAALRELAGDLG